MAEKRKKPTTNLTKLEKIGEVDNALSAISILERQLSNIENKANEAINDIKANAALEAEPIVKEIERLGESIRVFTDYNRDDVFKDGKKTVELVFGFIGYRQSTKISIKKTTLELLKSKGFLEGVRTKEEVNKEILGTWKDDKLSLVDAKRVESDEFWYETKKETITDVA